MTDPFAPDLTESPEALEFLTLEDLNRMVSNVLRDAFSTPLWVLAEVSEVRAHTNGFCYLTLVQKKERSQTPCARASALIMPFTYPLLRSRFISQTGTDLAPGMKLLAQVKVEFHVSFGYQLQIVDIDPSYTLGDVARRRREIIAALEADGVMELNKSLFLPRLLSRIAIVSSPTAAGYEDFLNQLSHSPFGFRTKLFPAIMQGERVEESIVGALDAIAAEADAWDVVVIIRGGGATSDLSGFDSYELASNVAQFPLPVLTGIGHERDDTVIDLVAHTRLKTPTAVAVFLIDSRRREADALEDLCQRLLNRARFPLEQAKGQLGALRLRLSKSVMPLMVAHHNALWRAKNLTRTVARENLQHRVSALRDCVSELRFSARSCCQREASRLQRLEQRLLPAVRRRLEHEQERLRLAERQVALASPERMLKLGFSITTCRGKVVREASELIPGDILVTHFAQGTAESRVTTTQSKPNEPKTDRAEV